MRRMWQRKWLAWGLMLAILLPLLAACISSDDNDPPEPAATATTAVVTTTTPAADATATQTAAPDATDEPVAATSTPTTEPESTATSEPAVPGERPVDVQLSWLLLAMNGTEQNEEEVEGRLHPAFIEQVPVAGFAALLDQLAAAGPWEFDGYLGNPVGLDGYAIVTGPSNSFQIIVGLEAEAPNRFMTLLFLPYTAPSLSLASFDGVDQTVADSAPLVSLQVAEISDGTCTPLHGVNADQSLAIASAFKLWVLLELAERVAAGELSWDDTLAISPELVSLPSGTLQVEEPGLELDLQTYAAKMIALSDNTATDHLIDLLGRENVEARFAATGHATPQRNVPLLLTREFFYLKLAASEEELATYVAADSAGRRALLAEIAVDLDLVDPNRLSIPTAIDSVEWFASAADFCGVLAALRQAGESDPVVREILAAAAGVALDPEVWSFVGYKGGNEAGVGSGVWLLERADGRLFTVSAIMNNPDAGVNVGSLPALTNAIATLLAELG